MLTYKSISVTRMSPNIGAEIGDVDLTKPLDAHQVQELHDALTEHLVLFFRDQPIDFEAHRSLARHFGELHVHVAGDGTNSKLTEDPAIRKFHFDANSESVSGELWHTDQSVAPIPPMGSILYLHTIPPNGGGDTLFASMYAAYEALSPGMKTYLQGLTATHDGRRGYATTATNSLPISVHPLITKHPVTGRKVIYFTAAVVSKINELPELESDAVIAFLKEHCAHPDFQYRFRWQPHSIAFWDNRCVHHRAIWDYYPATRSGYRVQIKGAAPPIPA